MERQLWLVHKGIFSGLVISSIFYSVSLLVQAYSIVQIIQLVFLEESGLVATYPYFLLLLGAITIRLIATTLIDQLGGRLSFHAKKNVRARLIAKWNERTILKQFSKKTGEETSLFIQTVDELDPYYREYIPQAIKSILVPLAILIAVFYTHVNSGWIMLITAPFIPLTYIIVGIQTKHKAEEQLTAMNRFSGTFLDLLQGVQTIRIFRQQQQKEAQLKYSNAQFLTKTMDVLTIAFASTLFIELITTLGIGLIALEIGFQMIVFESLTFAPAFLVLILAPEFYNTLKQLGSAFHTAKGSAGAMALLHEALHKDEMPMQWGIINTERAPSLTLENATYRYEDGTTIGPLQLRIRAGQTVALIGPTGHGKSTILNLLAAAMTPTAGQYFIGATAQSSVDEQSFYKEMVYISQRTSIFAGTLRQNLQMDSDATDADCLQALEKASLLPWFARLQDGLETVIGEGGRGLSGGEQQRLAIARAFVKQPSIVLFDEPTAHLDGQTEMAISAAIEQLSKEATTVIVSHRYESIRFADYIFIIENGHIVDEGMPESLKHPLYLQMKDPP